MFKFDSGQNVKSDEYAKKKSYFCSLTMKFEIVTVMQYVDAVKCILSRQISRSLDFAKQFKW